MTNSSNNVQEYIDYAPFLPPLLSTVRSIEYAAKSGIADGNYAASAVEYLESLRAVFPQRPLLGDMMSEQKDECQKYTNNQNESVAEDNVDCHNTRFGDTTGKIKIIRKIKTHIKLLTQRNDLYPNDLQYGIELSIMKIF